MSDVTQTPVGDDADVTTWRRQALDELNETARVEEKAVEAAAEPVEGARPVKAFAPASARHQKKIATDVGARDFAANAPQPIATIEARRKQVREVAEQLGLTRTAKSTSVDNSLENCRILLEHFFAGRIWFEKFSQKIYTTLQWSDIEVLSPPRPWEDADTLYATAWLQANAGYKITKSNVEDAVSLYAKSHAHDALVDWLDSLQWDGRKRLSLFIPLAFGTSTTRYHMRAGRNMLLGMVARAYMPACKVDEALVFEGAQGTYKSSALRILGGEYYAELLADPRSKDFEQQLLGIWLGEFAELSTLRGADVGRLRQFITNDKDHIRLPYGRHMVDLPRRTVLCGTTNEECYLNDPTGARRFIPVTVGRINLDWLRANREQAFAEAVHRFKQGRKWWKYPKDATRAQQDARQLEDTWVWQVQQALHQIKSNEVITSALVLERMGVRVENQTHANVTRVGIALRKLGARQDRKALVRKWTFPGGLPK